MEKEEITVINFVLRHITEHPANEAAEVLYALARLSNDKIARSSLFEKAKKIESLTEELLQMNQTNFVQKHK